MMPEAGYLGTDRSKTVTLYQLTAINSVKDNYNA